ncbi:MAG: BTAD domain-containing putative transcriptional regulator, partial [Chloroflexota bacterium]
RTKVAHLLYHLTQAEMTTGNHPQAYADIERLLTLAPWHEGAYQLKMQLLYKDGHRWAALEQYATLQAVLREELDVEPSAKTEALIARIRADEDLRGLDEYPIQIDHDIDHDLDNTAIITQGIHRQGIHTQERAQTVNQPTQRLSTQQERVQQTPQPTQDTHPQDTHPQDTHPQDSPARAFINSPAPLVPLIGHRETLNLIVSYLQDPAHRLITLMGMGGVGKSHIALTVGQMFVPDDLMSDFPDEFPHGVGFVPLAGVEAIPEIEETPSEGSQEGQAAQDTQRFVSAIARTLQLSQGNSNEVWTQVVTYLRERTLLLILDNFEHVLGARLLLTELAQQAPTCTFLVTSRVRLQIMGETAVQINPLPIPTQMDVADVLFATPTMYTSTTAPLEFTQTHAYASIQLFLMYARRYNAHLTIHEGDFGDIIQLCHLTGGLPLALTLVATWTEHFPLDQIVRQLQKYNRLLTQEATHTPASYLPDMHDAQQYHSLEAFFDQAWRMLSPRDQQPLMLLSNFVASFDLDAAQSVVGVTMFDLKRLTDTSLIHIQTAGRYEFHPLTRAFLQEKCQGNWQGKWQGKWQTATAKDTEQEKAFWEKYIAYYLTFLADHAPRLDRREAKEALMTLRREQDHIHLAWQQAVVYGHVALLQSSLDGLAQFYIRCGLATEVFAYCRPLHDLCTASQNALAVTEDSIAMQSLRFHVAVVELETRIWLNQYADAHEQAEAIQSWDTLHLDSVSANLAMRYHLAFAFLLRATGNIQESRTYLVRQHHQINQTRSLQGKYHFFLMRHALHENNHTEAIQEAERALHHYRQDGNLWEMAHVLRLFSHCHEKSKKKTLIEEALSLSQQIGRRDTEASCMTGLAVTTNVNKHEQRIAYQQQAIAISKDLGNPMEGTTSTLSLSNEYTRLGQYAKARDIHQSVLAKQFIKENIYLHYLTLHHFSLLETLDGNPQAALTLIQEAQTVAPERITSLQAFANICQGHTWLAYGDLHKAQQRFDKAYDASKEVQDAAKEFYVTALAEVAYAQGQLDAALPHVDWLLPLLARTPDAHEFPSSLEYALGYFRPHGVCYQVLTAMGDGRASDILQSSYGELRSWADGIEDRVLRRSFLEDVVVNRMIVEAVES